MSNALLDDAYFYHYHNDSPSGGTRWLRLRNMTDYSQNWSEDVDTWNTMGGAIGNNTIINETLMNDDFWVGMNATPLLGDFLNASVTLENFSFAVTTNWNSAGGDGVAVQKEAIGAWAVFTPYMTVRYTPRSYPGTLQLDINNDSSIEWSIGELNSTQWASNRTPNIFTSGGMIPLNITSTSEGIVELSGLNYGPYITASSPANGYSTTDNETTLTITATDPESDTITYYFYNSSGALGDNTSNTFLWNMSLFTNGSGFWWWAQVNDSYSNSSTSTNSSINLMLDPDICAAGTPNELKIFEFNEIDEETFSNLSVVGSGFIGATATITHNNNEFTFSISNNSWSMDLCVDEVYSGDSIDVNVEFHNGTLWPLASWYIRDHTISSTTTYYDLGLLNTTFAQESYIFILDSNGNPAQNYFVTLLIYDYSNSEWRELRMARTGISGRAVFNLRRDDRYYSFFVYDEDFTYLQTFSNYIISDLETTLPINLTATSPLTQAILNVDSSCTSTNVSINCTMQDNNDPLKVTQTILKVWEGGAINFTDHCTATNTSNPSTVSCAIDGENETYFYSLRVDMGPTVPLESGTVGVNPQDDYGQIGVFTAAFLSLILGFVGAYNPIIFVLLIFVGYIMSILMQLVIPTSAMTISLFATLAIVVIWRLKPK